MFFQLVFKCRIRCWKQIKCFLDCCIFQTEDENQNSSRITFTFRYKENHVCSDRLNFNFSLALKIFRLQKLLEGGGILTILGFWQSSGTDSFTYFPCITSDLFSLYVRYMLRVISLNLIKIQMHNGTIQQNRNFNGVV